VEKTKCNLLFKKKNPPDLVPKLETNYERRYYPYHGKLYAAVTSFHGEIPKNWKAYKMELFSSQTLRAGL
jgi:hypothetical protein